jgi:hypothetical protein
MSSNCGSRPSSYRLSSSDISCVARVLTGRTHSPDLPSCHSFPARQRPEVLREFAKQTMVLPYFMSDPRMCVLRSPTFAITGVQKQSEAALLHVRVDGVVMRHCLVAATRGGACVYRTAFCFVSVPLPPVQTTDEFFDPKTQLGHV